MLARRRIEAYGSEEERGGEKEIKWGTSTTSSTQKKASRGVKTCEGLQIFQEMDQG